MEKKINEKIRLYQEQNVNTITSKHTNGGGSKNFNFKKFLKKFSK